MLFSVDLAAFSLDAKKGMFSYKEEVKHLRMKALSL